MVEILRLMLQVNSFFSLQFHFTGIFTDGKLRGIKGWGMLGGVQTSALIKSPEIDPNSSFDGMFHITDWLATLTEMFKLQNVKIPDDSFSQLSALTGKGETRQVDR